MPLMTRENVRRHAGLAPPAELDAPGEDVVRAALDFVEQPAVDPEHCFQNRSAGGIKVLVQRPRTGIVVACPRDLELHQLLEALATGASVHISAGKVLGRQVKPVEVFAGEIDASSGRVLPQVAENVRQLKRGAAIN